MEKVSDVLPEFEEVTGYCLWGCNGDSIDGHEDGCLWLRVSDLQARAKLLEEAGREVMKKHDQDAVNRNFTMCGCDWCNAMRPLLYTLYPTSGNAKSHSSITSNAPTSQAK